MSSPQEQESREGEVPLPPLLLEAPRPGLYIHPREEKAGAQRQG